MLRVRDAEMSLKFYKKSLGMSLLRTNENANAGFTLYFLGYPGVEAGGRFGEDTQSSDLEGLLELTHNHGTENEEAFKYHDGNSEPQGFGHICE